jgi:hypothetical protein
MAYVDPIADKRHIRKAARFIKDNFDPAYSLIWQIGIETGYRITDITELKYSDIDQDNSTIKVTENKGTRSNQARARLKVLEQVKNELLAMYSNNNQKMMQALKNSFNLQVGQLLEALFKAKEIITHQNCSAARCLEPARWLKNIGYMQKDVISSLKKYYNINVSAAYDIGKSIFKANNVDIQQTLAAVGYTPQQILSVIHAK